MVSIQRYDSATSKAIPKGTKIPLDRMRYLVRWREGGKQKSKSFNLLRDAETFAREQESALRLGDLYAGPLQDTAPTFGAFAGLALKDGKVSLTGDGWFARYRVQKVAKATYKRRVGAKQHLAQFIEIPLDKIDPLGVEIHITDLADTKRRTAKIVHETVQMVMRSARTMGYRVNERIFEIQAPAYGRAHTKKKHTYLTVDQAKFLADNSGDDLIRCYVRFAFTTGLRPGEALVLTDSDIDGEHVWVRGTLQDGKKKDTGKTKAATRSVPMPSLAKLAVKEAKVARAQGSEVIFAAPEGGFFFHSHFYPRWHDAVKRASAAWVKKYGGRSPFEGMTPHDLRHTYVSLISGQFHPKEVQELVGHSSSSVTEDIYHKLRPNALIEAVARLEAIL